MRIFYLFPEEFPQIYAMTDETKRLSELGIRRLLQLVNGGGEAKGTKGG